MRRLPPVGVLALLTLGWVFAGLRGLLLIGSLAAVLQLLALRFALADLSAARWRGRRPNASPDALARSFAQVCDELGSAGHTSREFDRGLRRRLTRIFSAQLLERRGARIDWSPQQARELVDDEVWQLLDPDRPLVLDRARKGVGVTQLRRVVDQLESL